MPDTARPPEKSERVYIFVCKGESCSSRGDVEKVRVLLKQAAREFPAQKVKISFVSCLGLCGEGPNILVVRGGEHFSAAGPESVPTVIDLARKHIER